MKSPRIALAGFLTACAVAYLLAATSRADTKPGAAADESTISSAVCSIVYPVDQSPSERGYHYIFYGNAFFINNEGFLLTAAHVLSQLNDTQPYILLRLPMAPPRLLHVTLVAMDRGHDVALLRATPNPFAGKYQVSFLPLLVEPPTPARNVEATALRPSRLKDPHSFDAFVEDHPSGQVLGYQFTSSDKGQTDTELFLFSHEVLLGDSGAPVVAAESQAVVGLVEGRWMRPVGAPGKQPAGIGAAVPIHYAISLLQQQGVTWHSFSAEHNEPTPVAAARQDLVPPAPLSLVAPPYPSQALLGGEVLLDALVDRQGQLADIKVVRGAPPFLDRALGAVKSWSFFPARQADEAVEARIGIAFTFVANMDPLARKPSAESIEPIPDNLLNAKEHGAMPGSTGALPSPPISGSEASVILAAQIDADGHPASVKIVRDEESLGSSASSAVNQWQFTPAAHAGANCVSTFIAVEVLRAGASPNHAKSHTAPPSLVQ